MAAQLVSETVRCRPSRLRHLPTERMVRRLAFLEANLPELARSCDGRASLRAIAHEILAIRHELGARICHII